jgi:hypothetical protein
LSRVRAFTAVLVVALVLAGCRASARDALESNATPVARRSPASPRPAASEASSPSPASTPDDEPRALPRLVRVGSLPSQGVVVSADRVVRFITVDGRVVRTLRGYELENHSPSPGRVALSRHGTFYLLHADAGVLVRLRSQHEVFRYLPPNEELRGVPPASRIEGQPVGHWRWAIRSPTSSMVLGQWSGECEVPTAFLWDGDDAPGLPITGEVNLSRAPESMALGWTVDGRAVALMREGLCSNGTRPPGVYAYTSPGVSRLVFEVRRGSLARMWGSAGTVLRSP